MTSHIERLEDALDRFNAALPPLKDFILPGGSRAAAFAHVARTVCRRAERRSSRSREPRCRAALLTVPEPPVGPAVCGRARAQPPRGPRRCAVAAGQENKTEGECEGESEASNHRVRE